MADKQKNFFAQFRTAEGSNFRKLTATEFAHVWSHFDTDGNGFIEGKELDRFVQEFMTAAAAESNMDAAKLEKLKADFMNKYDANKDQKIEITEMACMLPEDENFLLLFRRATTVRSSQEFMKIWKMFDKDNSGFLEAAEVELFLKELVKEEAISKNDAVMKEYAASIVKLFDVNKDSKLQLSELARLLPTEENYLCNPILKNSKDLKAEDIDKIFNHYDKDGSGTIEDAELDGFMKDLLELLKETYTIEDFEKYKHVVLGEWDVDHDGKISRDELKMILLQHQKLAATK